MSNFAFLATRPNTPCLGLPPPGRKGAPPPPGGGGGGGAEGVGAGGEVGVCGR